MIPIAGKISIVVGISLIAFRAGYESALYWASPKQLAEAAEYRIGYYLGVYP